MPALDDLKEFDIENATLTLWVFKKSTPSGEPPRFNGHWVETTDDLDAELRSAFLLERDKVEETLDYSLLAQNNEVSVLSISSVETHAGLVVDQAAAETPNKKVTKLKQLQNSAFYLIKAVSGDSVVHAVAKAGPSWRTKKALTKLSVYFSDDQLDLETEPAFDISRYVDFFIVGDDVLVRHKAHFESILNYKETHREDFVELQADAEFVAIFDGLAPLVEHVGENKIQLRRASAIRQKGHYKNDAFMENLRNRHAEFGLTLNFDAEGRIVPTPETCRDIIIALLDHRLASAFSATIYDVPDATPIAV
jgi:hypothetical protein